MIVHDLIDNICIDMSKINACRVMKTCNDIGVISFESAYSSGYNLYFPNIRIAKNVFEMLMISLKSGAAYFDIDDNLKYPPEDDEFPFS